MEKRSEEPERENRITYEAVVDAYDEIERAMGWYCYLEDRLEFPFEAICRERVSTSPLKVGEKVKALSMADSDTCIHDMFATVAYEHGEIDIPLKQIEGRDVSCTTAQAIADWRYWVERGYMF